MPTVEDRYKSATEYVRRAVSTVETRGIRYTIDPISGIVEWYAGKTKTAEPRNQLARIEARWLRAATGDARNEIARDAELLADRVEESLPGAPQDRARTNLFEGEPPSGTPATSYAQEVDNQADEVSGWLRAKTSSATREASSVGKWLLVGGGIALAWKGVDYLRRRSAANETESALNASLVSAARNSSSRRAPAEMCSISLTAHEIEALHFLSSRYASADALFSGLVPTNDDANQALEIEFVDGNGPYEFQIRRADVRKALRATKNDGGDYGAIPNLRSDAVEWLFADETNHER
jgi:hypothetical protein